MSKVVSSRIAATVLAGACMAAAFAANAQSAMPAWQGTPGARWVCGGIGSDESTAMRSAMKDHPLALLFARADGAYQANVQVDIRGGASGSSAAMSFRADGPVCLVDVAAGKYTIDATVRGDTKSQTVTVGEGSKTASFRF